MGSEGVVTASAIPYILVLLMLVGTARSDFQQDRTECADQLVDRDNPDLGIKFNVSLVAKLPSLCHAPVNVTNCIDILHLPAGSPDAKVFAGFANLTGGSVAAPVASALLIPCLFSLKANSTGGKSSTAAEKSGAERPANRWLVAAEVLCGLLLWTFKSFGV
ncbi:hypothetical protein D5086_000095 [Populus alba]|uniref:Uncharacterized protein n=1 Tax=Populus alba TaxID=43335 RepID=A0ACC4CWF0_POPAL